MVATTKNRLGHRRLLIALAFEKIIQHATVTTALLTNWHDIRGTVVVGYRWLTTLGALIGLFYAISLVGLLRGRHWSLRLITILALADVVGEFIAQGTLSITITVSFIVALIILLLARRIAQAETIRVD